MQNIQTIKVTMKGFAMAYGIENGVKYKHFEDLKKLTSDLGYATIKDAVIDLYEELGSTNEVAKKLKVCGSTVYNYLRGYSYKNIKGRGGPNNPTGIKYINHEPKGKSCGENF
jgi:hypothetical protein